MRLGSEEMNSLESHVWIRGRSAPIDEGVVMREKESSFVEARVSAPAFAPSMGERPSDATRDSTPAMSSLSMGTDGGGKGRGDGEDSGA